MARPIKQGLDYFPLDVDIDQDDKVQLIEALHGIKGFGVLIKILMRIYREGYYYKWTEVEQLLFSKRVDVDISVVKDVVNDCIKYSIFDEGMYTEKGILTSFGIQNRYFEAIKRRKSVEIDQGFLLIDVKNIVNADKPLVNVHINPQAVAVNDYISTQSKVKESKGKNINTVHQDELFEEWWKLYNNKQGRAKCITKYKSLLKKYPHEQMMAGTEKYIHHRKNLLAKNEFCPQQKNPSTFLNGEHFNDEYGSLFEQDTHTPIKRPKAFVEDLGED